MNTNSKPVFISLCLLTIIILLAVQGLLIHFDISMHESDNPELSFPPLAPGENVTVVGGVIGEISHTREYKIDADIPLFSVELIDMWEFPEIQMLLKQRDMEVIISEVSEEAIEFMVKRGDTSYYTYLRRELIENITTPASEKITVYFNLEGGVMKLSIDESGDKEILELPFSAISFYYLILYSEIPLIHVNSVCIDIEKIMVEIENISEKVAYI